jgi:hypothetical protein
MTALRFKIGGREHEFVQVEVVGDRANGWLPARVSIRVGGFNAEYICDLDGGAFSRFASELRELHRTLKGVARFSSYEEQIELSMVGDGRGHITVTGEAMDVAVTGNALTFRLEVDQTELPQLIGDVDAIATAHPAGVP